MNIDQQSKIAVLLGGTSKERDVSLNTGSAIFEALQNKGYQNVSKVDPSENPHFDQGSWDAVFIALHGQGGEDGSLQARLEEKHIAFTGSGSDASRLAMSKHQSKVLFEKNGIPTLDFVVSNGQSYEDFEKACMTTLDFPMIGKPDLEGSSIGMEIVHTQQELRQAFQKTHEYGSVVIWEKYLQGGVDLTVAIVGGRAFPVVEIRPKSGLYDYVAKYTKGKTDYFCPARISDELTQKIQTYALEVFEVLGLRGWARIDFMSLGEDVYCLEANTVPGMTPTSLVPMAAKQAGISFEDLVEMILKDAKSF